MLGLWQPPHLADTADHWITTEPSLLLAKFTEVSHPACCHQVLEGGHIPIPNARYESSEDLVTCSRAVKIL